MIPILLQGAGYGEEGTAALLNVAVAIVALVLLGLSLSAYRRTRLSRLLLVSAAFGLFAASFVMRNIEILFYPSLDADEIVVAALELAALVSFFAALVMRD